MSKIKINTEKEEVTVKVNTKLTIKIDGVKEFVITSQQAEKLAQAIDDAINYRF